MNRNIIALAAFAILPSLAAGTAASAAPAPAQGPSAVVRYWDLDLATQAGRSTLDRRVERAARHLCLDERISPFEAQRVGASCYASALASAGPQMRLAVAKAGTGPGILRLAARR